MIETRNTRTIYDAIEQIKQVARTQSQEWAKAFAADMGIKDGPTLQEVTHALLRDRPRHIDECFRTPKQTAFGGGDLEDCAAFAICLAEALELAYEMRVKGGTLFLYVNGVEVLHK